MGAAVYESGAGLAPYELPRGRRGVRGRVAALAALGAIGALMVAHRHGTTSSTDGPGAAGYTYAWHTEFAHSAEAHLLWLSMALLLAAAALLWRVHARRLVLVAAVLALGGAVGAAWSISHARDHASPSPATVSRLALGITASAVRERLGEPVAASASVTRAAQTLPCVLYALAGGAGVSGVDAGRGDSFIGRSFAVLCFAHDRLVLKVAT